MLKISLSSSVIRGTVRKPCLIKKALRLRWVVGQTKAKVLIVRKPCLIKKALRPKRPKIIPLRSRWRWENLAWLRRHYDQAFGPGKIHCLIRLWENLAWLRRHYDGAYVAHWLRRYTFPVRKPCLIKKALRRFFRHKKPLGQKRPVRKPCLIKKALRLV